MQEAKRLGDSEFEVKAWFNLNQAYSNEENDYLFIKSSLQLANYIQSKPTLSRVDSVFLRKTYKKISLNLDYDAGSKSYNEYLARYKRLCSNEGIDYEELCLLEFENKIMFSTKSDEKAILDKYRTHKKSFRYQVLLDQLDIFLAQYYSTIGEYKKSDQLIQSFTLGDYSKEIRDYKVATIGVLSSKSMLMGQNSFMLQKNEDALLHLKRALQHIEQVELDFGLGQEKYIVLSYLSKAYSKKGNYKQAYLLFKKATEYHDRLIDKQKQSLLAEHDVQLEEIKQEKKLNEARTQTLLKVQEVKAEKQQKYIFLGISILTLLSLAWALYSFNKTRKQNQIISQQAAALEESNLLKDKIFALLSHDLRSPINRLVMTLNHSVGSQHTPIQAELKGVQDILNNVLYWAAMQLKKATPIYIEVPLQPLADTLIEEYQYALDEKNITFLNTIESNCLIKTDEGYLKIVLRNLISNAIKFTSSEGYIQINCKVIAERAEISLKDTGVGIAAHKLDGLFQLPTPSVGTNQEKGTGLGLSLSFDIVKKLGGNLSLKSREGKGTLVTVALPV